MREKDVGGVRLEAASREVEAEVKVEWEGWRWKKNEVGSHSASNLAQPNKPNKPNKREKPGPLTLLCFP